MFDSDEIDPAHNSGRYFSALVVVWFQATADTPTNDNAPAGLRSLAWDELARGLRGLRTATQPGCAGAPSGGTAIRPPGPSDGKR
ncbi:hypothetical protein P8A21_21075 [Streptomyces poriferorum]|uniref:hypothetical protein n=1 Tax=Streptomyces poriferorum TaxID=2798799 RepID=UPI00273FC56F|nr:hypothetical protein [Streptomyces sp. Alt1]WLQ49814.1 hypothetical protein P8A21_21075 [Streptomyces sp. Alt1]